MIQNIFKFACPAIRIVCTVDGWNLALLDERFVEVSGLQSFLVKMIIKMSAKGYLNIAR